MSLWILQMLPSLFWYFPLHSHLHDNILCTLLYLPTNHTYALHFRQQLFLQELLHHCKHTDFLLQEPCLPTSDFHQYQQPIVYYRFLSTLSNRQTFYLSCSNQVPSLSESLLVLQTLQWLSEMMLQLNHPNDNK